MMKKIIILIYVITSGSYLFAQGFDWQYSSRLPARQPNIFIGIGASYGQQEHYGEFSFFEDYFCGKYQGGSGNGYSIDLNIEKWVSPNSAIFLEAAWTNLKADFTSRQVYEMLEESLVTEYIYRPEISSVRLNTGIKFRLPDSKFHVGALLCAEYIINESSSFREKVISPDWYYFDTDPPGQERILTAGHLKNLNRLMITPAIQAGYDMNLGLGRYATPYLRFQFPINSYVSSEDWRSYGIALGISVRFGFDM